MIKKLGPEFVLHLIFAVLLATTALAGAVGYFNVQQQHERIVAVTQKARELGAAVSKAAPAQAAAIEQLAAQAQEESADAARGTALAVIVVVILAFLSTIVLRAWIRSVNTGPLKVAARLVRRIADGDLTVSTDSMVEVHTRKLQQAINDMTARMRQLVGEVQESARTVAETSAQIAHGNLDLSQRTEEQASTLEETASSMEELTSTVAQNADNARQASQLAVTASDVARKGGQVVGQVVSTMRGISDSSRRIGDIIGVIDGIAFQTNILALNAAVEAARAGEQGRGFAVVAAEVRNLAQRSAAAAKEIKTLIGDSVDKVEAGGKLVDSAGRTMEEIVSSVKKVSDLIAEIAAASQEQSSGIGQVNTAVAQMEQVVQQNASLVEEATAATESMKDQASHLLQLVSRFKIDEAGAVPVTPIRRAPQPEVAPTQVRTGNALPPARAAALPGAGGWEEF